MQNKTSGSLILRRMLSDASLHVAVCFLSSLAGGFVATYGRSDVSLAVPVVLAALAGCMTILPSVILRNLILDKGFRHLMAIIWRLPISFAMLALLMNNPTEQRKCLVIAFMTCYFVTLTLESWLQIRQANAK